MTPILSIELPVLLTNDNKGRGRSWYASAKARKQFEAYLKKYGYSREPFPFKVVVHVTRILGKGQRFWDSSSGLRGNYKELEDSLVAVGWFIDDSPRYITETRFFQNDTRREEPAVLIEVFKSC